MIETKTFFDAVCDRCSNELAGFYDERPSLYDTKEMLLAAIKDDGWKEIDGKTYCYACVKKNIDGTFAVLPPPVKTERKNYLNVDGCPDGENVVLPACSLRCL